MVCYRLLNPNGLIEQWRSLINQSSGENQYDYLISFLKPPVVYASQERQSTQNPVYYTTFAYTITKDNFKYSVSINDLTVRWFAIGY